jgi:WD40 repeat protein
MSNPRLERCKQLSRHSAWWESTAKIALKATSSPPLDLSGERRSQIDAIYRAIREHEPPRVSKQLAESSNLAELAEFRRTSTRKLVRQVSGELDWITQNALAKDPDERYQSAGALAEDLERHLRNAPLSIRSPSPWVALKKMVRRHRGSLAATALILASVLLGASSYVWQLWQTIAVNREMEARAYNAEVQLANSYYAQGNFGSAVALLDACIPGEGGADYRGWEWRHLRKLCEPDDLDSFSFQYGVRSIRDVEFSPDGSLVGIAQTSSKCAAVLDVKNKQIIAELNCNHEGVAVEFTPDGSLLAVVTNNGELYLWDYRTNNIVFRDQPSKSRLRGVAFRPDGQQFVVCGDTGIHWYDRQDLSGPFDFFPSKKWVTDVNYSPNGKMLVAGDRTEAVPKLWASISLFDTETQQKIGERTVVLESGTHSTEVRSVEFFHNNEQVLVGTSSGLIAAWQLGQPNPETQQFQFPTLDVFRAQGDGGVYSVKHSSGGDYVAAGASDNRVLLWDGRQVMPDGTRIDSPYLKTLRAHSSVIQALDFCQKTDMLVTADHDALIHFWKPNTRQNLIRTGHNKPLSLALSTDARMVAVGTSKGDVTCWRTDRQGPALVASYSSKTDRIPDVEFLPIEDSRHYHLAAIDLAGRLLLFKLAKEALSMPAEFEFKPQVIHGSFVRCVSDPLESCLWLSSKDGAIFRLQLDKALDKGRGPVSTFDIDPNKQSIVSIELLPKSGRLVSASWNRSVRLTNPRTSETLEILRPEFPVRELAVSPDERYLAVCGESRKLLIYDLQTGQRRELLGHSARVLSLKYSRDGTRLATGAEDSSVRMWDTERWSEVFSSIEAGGFINDLEFSADDTQLFIASSNNKILVLEAPKAEVAAK